MLLPLRSHLTSKELLCCLGGGRGERICAHCKQLKASFSERCVLLFKGLLILCDYFDQELQQQLIIETRNLKKTRNFYQKLIQQERKNKGLMAFQSHCVCVLKKKNPVDLQLWFLKQFMYSKGSECKPMLSKLKSQFEELKSKVVFLDCVKKYLEVLRNLYDSLLCIILCLITSI